MNVTLGILAGIVLSLLLHTLSIMPLLAAPICILAGVVTYPALTLLGRASADSGRGLAVTLLAAFLQTLLMVILGGLGLRVIDAADAAWGLGTILSVAWRVTPLLLLMLVIGEVRRHARADPTEKDMVTLRSLGLTQYALPMTYLVMAIWPTTNPIRLLL